MTRGEGLPCMDMQPELMGEEEEIDYGGMRHGDVRATIHHRVAILCACHFAGQERLPGGIWLWLPPLLSD